MRRDLFARSLLRLVFVGTLATTPALAADDAADLQAATRAIGFLDSLPHDGVIVIGIVYSPGDANREDASETAGRLAALPGPANATIRTVLIPDEALAKGAGRLDAVFLMPLPAPAARAIPDALRMRHVVSISTDPSCLDTQCCVLMIQTRPHVEIVLDTALANEVGARFSPIFTMLVKRR